MQVHNLPQCHVLPGLKGLILALHAALASLCTGWAASEQGCTAAARLGRKGYLPARVSGIKHVFASLLITVHWENCHSKTSLFFSILLSWRFSRCGSSFFFFFENLLHKNVFISVNLFSQRASLLQLINNASINHNHIQCRQRLILNNSVYKICSKPHLSLEVYLHVQNIQVLDSSQVWHWLTFSKNCLKAANYFSTLNFDWKEVHMESRHITPNECC